MANQADICNNALTMLGANLIVNISDGSNAARTLNAIFNMEREMKEVAMQEYKDAMMSAMRANALESPPMVLADDTWVAARLGDGGSRNGGNGINGSNGGGGSNLNTFTAGAGGAGRVIVITSY